MKIFKCLSRFTTPQHFFVKSKKQLRPAEPCWATVPPARGSLSADMNEWARTPVDKTPPQGIVPADVPAAVEENG